jgi:hypothetical protein
MKYVLAIGLAVKACALNWVRVFQKPGAHLVEVGQRSIVRKCPAAVWERVGVLERWRPYRRPPDVGNNRMSVDARHLLLKVFAMVGRPGVLVDQRQGVPIVGDSPAVAMQDALAISSALRHERILSPDKTAFDTRGFVGPQCIEPTHELSYRFLSFLPSRHS